MSQDYSNTRRLCYGKSGQRQPPGKLGAPETNRSEKLLRPAQLQRSTWLGWGWVLLSKPAESRSWGGWSPAGAGVTEGPSDSQNLCASVGSKRGRNTLTPPPPPIALVSWRCLPLVDLTRSQRTRGPGGDGPWGSILSHKAGWRIALSLCGRGEEDKQKIISTVCSLPRCIEEVIGFSRASLDFC